MVIIKKNYKFLKTPEYQKWLEQQTYKSQVQIAEIKQKKSLKNIAKLIEYDPIQELKDENFIGKAILECLINNDPEGVMEVIGIYLNTLEKSQFVQDARVPKSTLYHSLKSKNPTIKTLAKIVHATRLESVSQVSAKKH